MNDKIPVTAGQSIWTLKKINEFINFIINFYKNSDWNYIINYWNNYNNKLSGGISDMYLLYCYITNTTFKQNNFKLDSKLIPKNNDLSVIINNSFFDQCISLNSDIFNLTNWEQEYYNYNISNMENNIKKIIFINNNPYCRNLIDNKLYKCNSIHFHGCKNLMSKFYIKNIFYENKINNITNSFVKYMIII